jgi:hypothetical protein
MWVAIAAVAFTAVARAETRHTGSYSHPMFEFLARSQGQNSSAHSAALRSVNFGSRRQGQFVLRKAGSGALIAILPMTFVGLVSPFTIAGAAPSDVSRHATAASLLPHLFQRPPPSVV